jgi:hypothetical protein
MHIAAEFEVRTTSHTGSITVHSRARYCSIQGVHNLTNLIATGFRCRCHGHIRFPWRSGTCLECEEAEVAQ